MGSDRNRRHWDARTPHEVRPTVAALPTAIAIGISLASTQRMWQAHNHPRLCRTLTDVVSPL